MIVAVTSQNFKTVTAHAGKTRRFLLFEWQPGQEPAEAGRLDLEAGMAFHDFHGDGPHPLDRARIVLTKSAGAGFVARMARRGITVVITEETDPLAALRQLGQGAPANPNGGGCSCGHHGHHHDEDGGNGHHP